MDRPGLQIFLTQTGLFLLLASVVVFARLLPLTAQPGIWPSPDILMCLAFAWVLRQPDALPVMAIAAVFFMVDMLFQRPPGLFTALIVVATEILRGRHAAARSLPFLLEIGLVAILITGVFLGHWLICQLLMIAQPSFWAVMAQIPATVLIYPLVVLVLQSLFGVRRSPLPVGIQTRGRP